MSQKNGDRVRSPFLEICIEGRLQEEAAAASRAARFSAFLASVPSEM